MKSAFVEEHHIRIRLKEFDIIWLRNLGYGRDIHSQVTRDVTRRERSREKSISIFRKEIVFQRSIVLQSFSSTDEQSPGGISR